MAAKRTAIPEGVPARNAFPITPSDAADLEFEARGLYVGVAGDVVVYMADDTTDTAVTFKDLAAGMTHPISVRRVLATGTAATDLVGVY